MSQAALLTESWIYLLIFFWVFLKFPPFSSVTMSRLRMEHFSDFQIISFLLRFFFHEKRAFYFSRNEKKKKSKRLFENERNGITRFGRRSIRQSLKSRYLLTFNDKEKGSVICKRQHLNAPHFWIFVLFFIFVFKSNAKNDDTSNGTKNFKSNSSSALFSLREITKRATSSNRAFNWSLKSFENQMAPLESVKWTFRFQSSRTESAHWFTRALAQ